MLNSFFFTFNFFKFVQSGLYLDFFIKKNIEIILKNFLILTPQFFGEKFIVEFITKKILDSWFYNLNKFLGLYELISFGFFIQFISFIFFFLTFIILFI